MAHKRRRGKGTRENLKPEDHQFIEAFEAEYARLLEDRSLEAAKTYFRENFMVRCFGCGYLGKTMPP